jgi:hypothetical protein
VNDDPILALERELVGAARRHIAAQGRADSGPRPRAGGRRLRGLPSPLRAAALVALVLIPVAAVAIALTLPRASRPAAAPSPGSGPVGGASPAVAQAGPAPLASLVSELAVLRRPQTAADRDPRALALALLRHMPGISARLSRIRLAALAPWGAKVVLAPVNRQLLIIVGGSVQGAPLDSMIRTWGGEALAPLSGGRATGVVLVVPDGVTQVALRITRGGKAWTERAPVHDNVATVRLPVAANAAGAARITWYRADGTVVKRTPPPPPKPQAHPGPSLFSELAVLRRRQSAADLSLTEPPHAPRTEAFVGMPDRASARLAEVSAWGARVYLMLYWPPTTRVTDALPPRLRAAARRQAPRQPTLWILSSGGQGQEIGTAQTVADGQALAMSGGGPGNRSFRLTMVVPDGVTTVGFAAPGGNGSGFSAKAAVRDNVATLQVQAPPDRPAITWYRADGTVIRRIPAATG